ncbi:MAG: hypothetical protein IPK98_06005 [Chloracidobacterium sp.]|nr:hypothetical protein [Chloracidobacterium sp.]
MLSELPHGPTSAACSEILLGSDEVGEEALIRFYLLHVMILPLGLVGC